MEIVGFLMAGFAERSQEGGWQIMAAKKLYKAPSIRSLRTTSISKLQSLLLIYQTFEKHCQNALQVNFAASGPGCLCLCPGQCFANDRQYRPDHPKVIGNQRYRQEYIRHELL